MKQISKTQIIDMPTKLSDFTNDAGFITKSVDNLVNYYLKTETYSREQVDELIALITNYNNYITKDLGYVGSLMSSGESACADASNCGNSKIKWLIFKYGTKETPSVAIVHQKHQTTTTLQTIFFGTRVSERTITFSDSTRTTVSTVGQWSIVTSLFGIQATATNIVLRMLNPLLDTNGGLYSLIIPSVTNNTAGVLTAQQFGNLVNSSSVKNIWVGTQVEYDAIVTKDANTEYNIIESV